MPARAVKILIATSAMRAAKRQNLSWIWSWRQSSRTAALPIRGTMMSPPELESAYVGFSHTRMASCRGWPGEMASAGIERESCTECRRPGLAEAIRCDR